EQCQDMAGGAR
nr:RecName: Full=33 kDa cell wall protein [Nicotiana tabacum]